jgi:hypothetical protein
MPPGLNAAILQRTVRLDLIGYYPEEFVQFRENVLYSTTSAALYQAMFHVYEENDTCFVIARGTTDFDIKEVTTELGAFWKSAEWIWLPAELFVRSLGIGGDCTRDRVSTWKGRTIDFMELELRSNGTGVR